jgi:cytochrome P450
MSTHAPSLAATPMLAPELPGPWPLGNFPALRRDTLGLFSRAWRECGPMARVRFGRWTALFAFDPEAAKHVLVDHHGRYSKKTRGYEALRLLLGQGLVTSEGELWRRQRRIANPSFHRRRIAVLTETMRQAAVDMCRDWDRLADGREIDIAEEMMRVTLRIAGETLFSVDLSDESGEVGGAVTEMLAYFKTRFAAPVPLSWRLPTPGDRRGRRALETLDRVVHQIIDERQRSGETGDDLLGMFMDARDEETGEGMDRKQLRDEVITMLVAGHETTANALAWTLYLLSKHPEVCRRVEEEIDGVVAQGSAPSAGDLERLVYTSQALSEAMRLYPPVWSIARRADQDDVIAGYQVDAGTFVVMSPWIVHRDPELWPNPEGFDPDRFGPDGIAHQKGRPRCAYFPFSVGPRKCIGDHFARTEALIILGAILRNYRIALSPHQWVVPEASVTLRPRDGIRVTLQRR